MDDKENLAALRTLTLIDSDKVPRDARIELKRDYKLLTEYAQETFFDRGCRVNNFYEMKENAQVMLLWNLDLPGKLANGSRGVIKGFFPAEGYCYLIHEELKRRSSTGKGMGGEKDEQADKTSDDTPEAGEKPSSGKEPEPRAAPSKVKEEPTKETTSGEKEIKRYDFSHLDPELVKRVKESIEHQDWLKEELSAME
eukprot:scaffold30581_cov67-Skeletonema_dohrnii-CCMP3373.AAC.1